MKYLSVFLFCFFLVGCNEGYQSFETNAAPASYEVRADPFAGGGGANPFGGAAVNLASDASSSWGMFGSGTAKGSVPVASASNNALRPVTNKTHNTDRMIVRRAFIGLIVPNIEAARTIIESSAKDRGGFVESSSLSYVTVRVPTELFSETVDEILQIGVITKRDISSDDVTDSYTDIQLRIEVAEGSHKRLLDLLDRVEDAESLLEIEVQLRRLTQEIESLKAQLRTMANRVAYSTIRVDLVLKESNRAALDEQNIPFSWIWDLGVSKIYKLQSGYIKPGFLGDNIKLEGDGPQGLPEGFQRIYHEPEMIVAATPVNHRYRATVVKIQDEQSDEFWRDAVMAHFTRSLGYELISDEDSDILEFKAEIGGLSYRYDLAIHKLSSKKLLVHEYVCPFSDTESGEQVTVHDAMTR